MLERTRGANAENQRDTVSLQLFRCQRCRHRMRTTSLVFTQPATSWGDQALLARLAPLSPPHRRRGKELSSPKPRMSCFGFVPHKNEPHTTEKKRNLGQHEDATSKGEREGGTNLANQPVDDEGELQTEPVVGVSPLVPSTCCLRTPPTQGRHRP